MPPRSPEGPPPPPAVQRLRVRYAKRGRLRFASHRDVQRALERALRRAAVPIAYSAGFSPHPRISYAGAAPTGAASEAEYLELGLQERSDPDEVRSRLDAALPAGLDVLEVVEAEEALAPLLEASAWRLELRGVAVDAAARAVAVFLSAQAVPVQRLTKNGLRTIDARAPVVRLGVGGGPAASGAEAAGPACAILTLVVRHVTPAVRPDDVLTGLSQVADLAPPVPALITRLAQGPLDEGFAAGPLAAYENAVGAG